MRSSHRQRQEQKWQRPKREKVWAPHEYETCCWLRVSLILSFFSFLSQNFVRLFFQQIVRQRPSFLCQSRRWRVQEEIPRNPWADFLVPLNENSNFLFISPSQDLLFPLSLQCVSRQEKFPQFWDELLRVFWQGSVQLLPHAGMVLHLHTTTKFSRTYWHTHLDKCLWLHDQGFVYAMMVLV